jgi:hypothetical protein
MLSRNLSRRLQRLEALAMPADIGDQAAADLLRSIPTIKVARPYGANNYR